MWPKFISSTYSSATSITSGSDIHATKQIFCYPSLSIIVIFMIAMSSCIEMPMSKKFANLKTRKRLKFGVILYVFGRRRARKVLRRVTGDHLVWSCAEFGAELAREVWPSWMTGQPSQPLPEHSHRLLRGREGWRTKVNERLGSTQLHRERSCGETNRQSHWHGKTKDLLSSRMRSERRTFCNCMREVPPEPAPG